MAQTPKLTRNQELVFQVLSDTDVPLSAYAVLSRLDEAGLRAPLQVYRALEKLMTYGLVYRIECLNAFVVCSHAGNDCNGVVAFAICDSCGHVTGFPELAIERRLKRWSRDHSFRPEKLTVEMRGLCDECQSRDSHP